MENNTEIKKIAHQVASALKYFEKERFGFESRTLKVLPEIDFSEEEIIIPVVTKNNKQIKISRVFNCLYRQEYDFSVFFYRTKKTERDMPSPFFADYSSDSSSLHSFSCFF